MKLIKRLNCKHVFACIRDIHGEEINHTNYRSVWKCIYCGKVEHREKIHTFYEKLKTAD